MPSIKTRGGCIYGLIHQLFICIGEALVLESEAGSEAAEYLHIGQRVPKRIQHGGAALQIVMTIGLVEIAVFQVCGRWQDYVGAGH